MSMWSTMGGEWALTSREADPDVLRCSDPPEESCSDAGCPAHGGEDLLIGYDEEGEEQT